MFKKINLAVVLLLFFVLVGAVGAADTNVTDSESPGSGDETLAVGDSTCEVLSDSNSHTIDSNNYNSYFDTKGNLVSGDVKLGDTIYLNGTLSGFNFIFNKKVNIVGTDSNNMKNSAITLLSGASGSTVSNLKIANTANKKMGIFLNNVDNCSVRDCVINNTGMESHCICVANDANYNNITGNSLTCYGITYGHGGTRSTPPLIVSGSHHNIIANNRVEADDANGIYLSSYTHDPIKGGVSNFNLIYNNTVHYNVLPTSWSYGIQVMGGNNTIRKNTVIGGYRGISTSSGLGNIIVDNFIINLTGADYNHLGVEVGGEYAIVGTSSSIIANNTVLGAKIISTGAGISVIDNSIAENNFLNVTGSGKGIDAGGSNVIVRDNVVFTESGSGIHEKDEGSGLLVENNTITSVSGVGILIEKLSSKRMPSNVTVVRNTISTGNKNAIDASGVQANTSNIDLKSNKIIGKGNIVSPAGVFDVSKPTYIFNGKTHYITPDNIREYINENGGLGPEINDSDIICFEGNFTNEIIYITKGIKITGNNPIFYNSSFKVTSHNVLIENLTIINKEANRVNAWGIFVNQANGVRIMNNNISVNDPKASYAIYVLESSSIEVRNNYLASEGTYLTFTLLSYACENCEFSNNTVRTIGTDEVHVYEPKKCLDGEEACLDGNEFCLDGGHIVPEIYRTYGILMLYSSNNIVFGNDVAVTSRLKEKYPTTGNNSSTNSLVGIDVYFNSHNNTLSNNKVLVKGMDNYIYGMGVLGYTTGHPAPEGQGASKNQFIENNITLEGNYFATGIILGWESVDNMLKGNVMNVKSEGVVYGVTLEMSQKSAILSNDFYLNSQVIYGIEAISSSANNISGNVIQANAITASGILCSNSNDNMILENLINVNNSGENQTIVNLDFISAKNSGIYLSSNSSNSNIHDNNITVLKGYAILIDEEAVHNAVTDNYLLSQNGNGNGAVNGSDNNIVADNYEFISSLSFAPVKVKYRGTGEFIVNCSGDSDGACVKLYDADGNFLNESIVSDGRAVLIYGFDGSYVPGNYSFLAKFFKDSFKSSVCDVDFEIVKGNIIINLENISIIQGDTSGIIAHVYDEFGNPIGDVTVQYGRKNSAGNIRSIGTAVTDGEGISCLNYTVPSSLSEGEHELNAEVGEMDYYFGANRSCTLTVLPRIGVTIIPNGNGGILAILKDSDGNLIADKKVSAKIGDTYYAITSNGNGEIILPENIGPGVYQVNVQCDAEGKYGEASASFEISVASNTAEPETYSIVGNRDYSVYYGNTVEYGVYVLDKNGNPVGSGRDVVFNIAGTTKTVKTDASGYAAYSAKMKTGKYTVSAQYNGASVSNQITFKPTLIAKNISKKKGKAVKFSVKLVNKNGKALKNKKITFKIKGKKYRAKTNKKGIATLSIKKLKVGRYTITSSYGGCTISNKITIKK